MVLLRLWRLCGRECRWLLRDPRLLLIIVLVPLGYTLLLGYIYVPKRVSQVPTWVIDEDHSQLSRSIRDALANSETFTLVREDGSLAEFRQATLHGEAFACLWIPPHFSRDLKRGRPVRLLTIIDGSNMLIANTVLRGATEIGATYGAGVQMKRLSMRGTPSAYALPAAMPIESGTRVWYNPGFNYLDFLLPGLIGAVIQQVTLLGVALAFTREREQQLLGEVLAITDSPLELLLAKGLTYTVINLAIALLSYLLTFRLFGVANTGSLGLVAVLLGVFITALVAMGLCISVLARDQLFATQTLMLIAVPSFLLSGYTWPQVSMLPWVKTVSDLLPLTHFVLPLRAVLTQGAAFAVVRPHLLWLWTLTALCYAGAYLIIRRVMRQAKSPLPSPRVSETAPARE